MLAASISTVLTNNVLVFGTVFFYCVTFSVHEPNSLFKPKFAIFIIHGWTTTAATTMTTMISTEG
jgi:hypothetical protein